MAQASAWWKFSPFLSYSGLYQQRLGAAVCEWRLFHPPPDSFNSSRMSVILGKVSREERRKPLNPAELLRARPLTNDFPHEGSRTVDRWEPGIKRKGLILKVLVSNLRERGQWGGREAAGDLSAYTHSHLILYTVPDWSPYTQDHVTWPLRPRHHRLWKLLFIFTTCLTVIW